MSGPGCSPFARPALNLPIRQVGIARRTSYSQRRSSPKIGGRAIRSGPDQGLALRWPAVSESRRRVLNPILVAPLTPAYTIFQQRVSSLGPKPGPSRGNIDGEWAHDLHASVNPAPSSLASRISQPGRPHSTRRAAQIASALMKQESQSDIAQASTTTPVAPPTQPKGISIRGLAGPFAVMAQNFAPGTTAADIESAMTPVGGEMLTCIILKTEPIVVAEMVFASREGGERVIATFNNQTVSQSPT